MWRLFVSMLVVAISIAGEVTLPQKIEAPAKGSYVTVYIDVENVTETIAGFEMTINFDPSVFKVENVTIGDFLGSKGMTVLPLGPVIDNEAGSVKFGAALIGESGEFPTGSGNLAKIEFVSLKSGSSDLTLSEVVFADDNAPPSEVVLSVKQEGSVVGSAPAPDDTAEAKEFPYYFGGCNNIQVSYNIFFALIAILMIRRRLRIR